MEIITKYWKLTLLYLFIIVKAGAQTDSIITNTVAQWSKNEIVKIVGAVNNTIEPNKEYIVLTKSKDKGVTITASGCGIQIIHKNDNKFYIMCSSEGELMLSVSLNNKALGPPSKFISKDTSVLFIEEIGLSKHYYDNGELEALGNYINGQQTGLWKLYRRNGRLESNGNFNNGQQTGLWKWYYDNGEVEKQKEY